MCKNLDCLKAWLYHGLIIAASNAAVLGLLWWTWSNPRLEAVAFAALLAADAVYFRRVW